LVGESVKSAILDKGERYYTYLGKIFHAIGNEQIKYNWLITNCECYPQDEEISEVFSKEYVWISGEQLTDIIDEEDFQFIYGVFSGFLKEITLEDVLKHDLPFADENEGFLVDDVSIQHQLADIEIVAFDSSMTLFISKNDDLVNKFRCYFPSSEDLSEQNTRYNSEIAHIEQLLIMELEKRNCAISKEILHQKYSIWRVIYTKRKREKLVKDEDILHCINKMLNQTK
jgi:hypothetical protein